MTRVLITGCSTGIGRAAAVELTKRGYEVIATARRPETLDELDVVARLALDVTDDASVATAVTAAGEIDVLVNNAGIEVGGPIESVPLADVRDMFETNVFGLLRMIQAVAPGMRRRGRGTIVNISSVAGIVGAPLGGTYSATKHAVEAISEALHYELDHFGVRTIIIEPGVIETAFQDNARWLGVDEPPYDELKTQWDAARLTLAGGAPPGPELVAGIIAEALEADPPVLRWTAGNDAAMVASVRASSTDEEFEATMREALSIDW
jgi:NADP-dependent 3-hydroxy acid dehydrogenase YdfG